MECSAAGQSFRAVAVRNWRRKQIQFPKLCVFFYLEFRMMAKVQKPSNCEGGTGFLASWGGTPAQLWENQISSTIFSWYPTETRQMISHFGNKKSTLCTWRNSRVWTRQGSCWLQTDSRGGRMATHGEKERTVAEVAWYSSSVSWRYPSSRKCLQCDPEWIHNRRDPCGLGLEYLHRSPCES
jgi:hypothetical protein